MGGNAKAIDRVTGQILKFSGREVYAGPVKISSLAMMVRFEHDLIHTLSKLDSLVDVYTNTFLWPEECSLVECFTGSWAHVHGMKNSARTEFIELKHGLVGDIDITIPVKNLKLLWETLEKIEGETVGQWVYVGQTKPHLFGTQLNTLWATQDGDFIQVDFEGVHFINGHPDEFALFAHSSPLDDLRIGIKGVAHKYLLQIITWVVSAQDVIVLTDKSPENSRGARLKVQHEPVRSSSFSVDRGFRQRLYSCGFEMNGKKVYKELPTSESNYITDLATIESILFTSPQNGKVSADFKSFVGLLKMMKCSWQKSQIEDVFKQLVQYKLYGKGQALYRDSAERDCNTKWRIIEEFWDTFPEMHCAELASWVQNKRDSYYVSYKERA